MKMTKKVLEDSIATIMASTKLENGKIEINQLSRDIRLSSIRGCRYKKNDLEIMLYRVIQKHGENHCVNIIDWVKNNPK